MPMPVQLLCNLSFQTSSAGGGLGVGVGVAVGVGAGVGVGDGDGPAQAARRSEVTSTKAIETVKTFVFNVNLLIVFWSCILSQ